MKDLNEFLSALLEKGAVDAVMAPQRSAPSDVGFPAMVSKPEKLKADPFAPVLPVSTARAASVLTREGKLPGPVAVVMRNCQLRALIELQKLNQADLENMIIIGVDCPGTFSLKEFREIAGEKSSSELYSSLLAGDEELTGKIRTSCQTCIAPVPENCDIIIGTLGAGDGSFELIGVTDKGKEILKSAGYESVKISDKRKKAVENLTEDRRAADEKFRAEHNSIKGIDKILEFFSTCINCHNCRSVCPICYCRECFFDSDALDQSAESLVSKSKSRGAFKMPLDTLLFHTGRFNHMILSCVECGLCEQACPSEIPLMQVTKRVAADAREKFGYMPGLDPEEDVPLKVFKEDEFTEAGEK